jgi:hypothetical protein
MYVVAPKIGVFQIFLGAVAEQPLDVLADEGRSVIVLGLERVDHGRRALQERRQARAGGVLRLLGMLAIGHVAPRTHDLERLAVRIAN